MGSPDPRSFSRGKRGIAGSLIWINFDRHALLSIIRKSAGQFLANRDDISPSFRYTGEIIGGTAIFDSSVNRSDYFFPFFLWPRRHPSAHRGTQGDSSRGLATRSLRIHVASAGLAPGCRARLWRAPYRCQRLIWDGRAAGSRLRIAALAAGGEGIRAVRGGQ